MQVDLFTFVDLYRRALDAAGHLLARGSSFAEQRGISPDEMLDWRLVDDMNPLRFQLMVVINFASQWPARVADLPVPEDVAASLSAAQFADAIEHAREILQELRPNSFVGRDDIELAYKVGEGIEPMLAAGRWISVFATTNLYFHLSIAYAILRAHHVPLGKVDLFPSGL